MSPPLYILKAEVTTAEELETAGSSETFVVTFLQITRHRILEDSNFLNRHCEKMNAHVIVTY